MLKYVIRLKQYIKMSKDIKCQASFKSLPSEYFAGESSAAPKRNFFKCSFPALPTIYIFTKNINVSTIQLITRNPRHSIILCYYDKKFLSLSGLW